MAFSLAVIYLVPRKRNVAFVMNPIKMLEEGDESKIIRHVCRKTYESASKFSAA